MEKRKIILPEKLYKKAPANDLFQQIGLDETKSLLTNDDRDIVLDVNKLFNQERNDSNRYKIYGKIRMIFKNLYNGTSSYPYLSEKLSLLSTGNTGYLPYNEFAILRNDVSRELTVKETVNDFSSFTGLTVTGMTDNSHKTITSITAPTFNWNIYLSYVFSGDTGHSMNYTLSGNTNYPFLSGDGIPFRIEENGNMYKLTSPIQHGMNEGEYVTISGKTFHINSIGDEFYNSEKYVINILKSQIPTDITFFTPPTVIFGKRCLDINLTGTTTSQYYVHKLKTLTNVGDYIIDKAGFESNIFKDERKIINDKIIEKNRMESILFDFKEPYVLSGITNNLGYTPTEVYTTLIFRNENGYFNYPPKVGYKFNFHNNWIDNVFTGSTETSLPIGNPFSPGTGSIEFTGGTFITPGTILTGAFVEYIPTEMKERIISESYYKLTNPIEVFDHGQTGDTPTFSGATVNNPFGLYYQPHYRIKLRDLSPYVETSNNPSIDNLPQNARYFPDEKLWKWRDLYDHGYIDDLGFGVDNPFINNTHYVKNEINLYLKNEALYNNKADGIFDFNKNKTSTDNINC